MFREAGIVLISDERCKVLKHSTPLLSGAYSLKFFAVVITMRTN